LNSPPKEKARHGENPAGLKTVLGRSGNPNDSATRHSAQAAVPEYATSWHAFVTWATGQRFAPTGHMVRIILAEIEEAI
jgi:hypothetical protein